MHACHRSVGRIMNTAVCVLALASYAAPSTQDQPAPAKGSLEAQLEVIRGEHDVPALGVALISAKDSQAAVVGVRRAGSESALHLEDPWYIGSCTKSITSAVAATVVESGKIDWSDTIATVLPKVAKGVDPLYREVTLLQLLSHRSIIPGRGEPTQLGRDDFEHFRDSRRSLVKQRQEAVALVLGDPPRGSAGPRFAYSNLGYLVAAAILETRTGKSWEDLVAKKLFQPLELRTAGFGAPGAGEKQTLQRPPRVPFGHHMGKVSGKLRIIAPDDERACKPSVRAPSGQIHMSVGDFARYAAWQLDGARLARDLPINREWPLEISQDGWRRLQTPPDDLAPYALGWAVTERQDQGAELSHSGSNGEWYARIKLLPERNLAAVAVCNMGGDEGSDATRAAIKLCLQVAHRQR